MGYKTIKRKIREEKTKIKKMYNNLVVASLSKTLVLITAPNL